MCKRNSDLLFLRWASQGEVPFPLDSGLMRRFEEEELTIMDAIMQVKDGEREDQSGRGRAGQLAQGGEGGRRSLWYGTFREIRLRAVVKLPPNRSKSRRFARRGREEERERVRKNSSIRIAPVTDRCNKTARTKAMARVDN